MNEDEPMEAQEMTKIEAKIIVAANRITCGWGGDEERGEEKERFLTNPTEWAGDEPLWNPEGSKPMTTGGGLFHLGERAAMLAFSEGGEKFFRLEADVGYRLTRRRGRNSLHFDCQVRYAFCPCSAYSKGRLHRRY
jgi:hypothetical protein